MSFDALAQKPSYRHGYVSNAQKWNLDCLLSYADSEALMRYGFGEAAARYIQIGLQM
jgi:hypothetical protein